MKELSFTAFVSLALAGSLPAQEARSVDLAAAVRRLVEHPELADARVGVRVVELGDGAVPRATDTDKGAVLVDHDGHKGFMVASNMKLISGAVALATLGADYRFETRLECAAPIQAGVLGGDLVLVGSGDPTLGGRHEPSPMAPMVALAKAVVDAGVREVRGRVVGDDNVHGEEVLGQGWQWDYQSAAYAAQISGLCFAENVALVEAQGDEPGAVPQVQVIPSVDYLVLSRGFVCAAADAKDTFDVVRRRATNTLILGGDLPAGVRGRSKVSVENPTRYAAAALRRALLDAGVAVGAAVDVDDVAPTSGASRTLLATHRSPPLREILVILNKRSQNLYAEQLLRAAGRAAGRAAMGAGDLAGGAAAAKAMLEGWGVPTDGLQIEDGSGLTRRNLVQPRQLAGLLAAVWRSPHRDVFFASLPVAGVDGTLASRFAEGPAVGHVHAKTGSISKVVALSGYVVRSEPGAPPLVFSIAINNFTCPASVANRAVDALVQDLARAAGWPD